MRAVGVGFVFHINILLEIFLDSHQMGKKWSILALGSDEQNPQRKPCIYGGVTVGKLK